MTKKAGKSGGVPACAASCAAALIVTACIWAPVPALADGVSADGATYDVTYTYMETEDAPETPGEIDAEGHHWKLRGMGSLEADKNYIHATKSATHTETKTATLAELASTEASFPQTWDVEVEGISGTIPLVGITRTAVYDTVARQVDYQQDFPGLPTNDVAQLAQSREYADGIWELSDVSWTVDATDETGVPIRYTAHCNYRGQVESQEIVLYELTASYEGTITDPENRMVTTATYVLDDPIVAAEEVVPEDPFPWYAAAVAGVAAAAAALTGFAFFYIRRSRARVVEGGPDGERLVARAKVKAWGEGWRVDVPKDVSLIVDGERKTWVELPARCLKGGRRVRIDQFAADGSRTMIYEGEAMERIFVANPLAHL